MLELKLIHVSKRGQWCWPKVDPVIISSYFREITIVFLKHISDKNVTTDMDITKILFFYDQVMALSTSWKHYDDVIMGLMASQITSLTIVYSTVDSGADQSKHQSSASLAFVWGIHRGPVNSPHKWPVTRKMFPFDDVIMISLLSLKFICIVD